MDREDIKLLLVSILLLLALNGLALCGIGVMVNGIRHELKEPS